MYRVDTFMSGKKMEEIFTNWHEAAMYAEKMVNVSRRVFILEYENEELVDIIMWEV